MPELPPLPAVADQSLSVILLARGDEPHAASVLGTWAKLLDDLGRDYELIVSFHGPAGPALAAVEERAGPLSRVQVLRGEEAAGPGGALREAVARASQPLLFYTTCDHQYDPADLKLLLAEIDRVHVASGYRRWRTVPVPLRLLGGAYRLFLRVVFGYAPEPLPGWLGWREHLYRAFLRAVFGVRLRDVNCAFRLMRREIFAHLPIQSHGDFVHAELLAKANFLGCYMTDDVLVTYRPQGGGESSWGRDFRRVFSHPSFEAAPKPPDAPEPAASA